MLLITTVAWIQQTSSSRARGPPWDHTWSKARLQGDGQCRADLGGTCRKTEGINKGYPNRAIHAKFTIAKESVTITCPWQRLKGRQGSVNCYSAQKEGSMYALIRGLLTWGNRRQADSQQGLLCGWFGEHIWCSLIGPELEAETKIGKLKLKDQVLTILSCPRWWFNLPGQWL